jgi:hypothetical protein
MEHDWGQLQHVLLFQEYLSLDNDDVTYEVRSLEQIMDWKFTYDVSEDGQAGRGFGGGEGMIVGKVIILQHFCQHRWELTLGWNIFKVWFLW